MYVRNNTDIAILYTVVGGGVVYGTILPGQAQTVDGDGLAESVSFSTDDGSPLPANLSVTLGPH